MYDAAYLYIAMKGGLTLVSGDEVLLDEASRCARALKSSNISRRLGPLSP